ncbi:MAG: hypothetical protein JGK30_10940 [Microcoleus sp. PH2017_40_RAT_O_B]|uniref:hypothetical protein n=1 Tax=Microcoleus sp. PH2017_40_RAT_O_B TaxID=2798850 RepID=UPI001DB540CF|nr:hypothetical protein [Microcoleus sp. PH2017_40_RAT_O_B]MCC3610004.1 hypothetical protein [Microcoleus sp. PH2017_40_RAT_O_B]
MLLSLNGRSAKIGKDGEMGRWGDGEMGRWGDGEMGRWGRWGSLIHRHERQSAIINVAVTG